MGIIATPRRFSTGGDEAEARRQAAGGASGQLVLFVLIGMQMMGL